MPKPTLIQRAFGLPTQTYADGGGGGSGPSSLYGDPTSGYASAASSVQGGLRRPGSIRSLSSNRPPSESGRSHLSRRSVTFDDGASDGGRSWTSSIASRDTAISRASTSRITTRRDLRGHQWGLPQQNGYLSSSSGSAIDIGPSLRLGHPSGTLLSSASMRLPRTTQKTSRRYSTTDDLLLNRKPRDPNASLTLPPPPMTKSEERYLASQRRMQNLAHIGDQPTTMTNGRSHSLRESSSDVALKAPPSSDRPKGMHRSRSVGSAPPRTGKKKKTPEEIVAALEKAGLLDRVMEVVQEEEEGPSQTLQPERMVSHAPQQQQQQQQQQPARSQPAVTYSTAPYPTEARPAYLGPPAPQLAPRPESGQPVQSQPVPAQPVPSQPMPSQPIPPYQARPVVTTSQMPTYLSSTVSYPTMPIQSYQSYVQSYPALSTQSAAAYTIPAVVQSAPPVQTQRVQPAAPINEAPATTTMPPPAVGPVETSAYSYGETKQAEPPTPQPVSNVATASPYASAGIPPQPLAVYATSVGAKAPEPSRAQGLSPALISAYPLKTISRAPPIQLILGERAQPSDAMPLILTDLSFERDPTCLKVRGAVRGLAPPFQILLRHTFDGWVTFRDHQVVADHEKPFSTEVPASLEAGHVEFAVRMQNAKGRDVWDNNEGRNYVSAFSAASPTPTRLPSPALPASSAPSAAAVVTSSTSMASDQKAADGPSQSGLPPALNPTSYMLAPSLTPTTAAMTMYVSPPTTSLESDRSEGSVASTAVTTPPTSDLGRPVPIAKLHAPQPVQFQADPSSYVTGAVPPRMTLTRTESAQHATVELTDPGAHGAVDHRVTFAPSAVDHDGPASPPVPVKSARRSPSSVPDWAPNAKSLTGSVVSMGSTAGIKKTKSNEARTANIAPQTMSETLPKARSVAQTLDEDPSAILADSLPKAPPRGKLLSDAVDQVPPQSARTPSPSAGKPANGSLPVSQQINGDLYPTAPSESLSRREEIFREPSPSRTQSISGGSFANEPFVSRRSMLGHHHQSPSDGQTGPYAGSRNNSSTPSQTSLVAPPTEESPTQAPSESLPSRRYFFGAEQPFRSTMSAMEAPRRFLSRPRSIFSDSASVAGGSTISRSNTNVPTAYRPTKNPSHVGYMSENLQNASPTMCAVAIRSNAAASLSRSRFALFNRPAEPHTPAHMSAKSAPVVKVQFTEIAAAPKKLGSGDVLVQIFAVGVDLWDRARVDTLVSRGDGYGYIPGRSFCGKAIECGVDVTRVHKGDFVYGLQDLRRSGCLAELCVVNRDYVALAPQGALSIEQIASLPCCGVSAFQAMETLCQDLPRGSKVLILNAHTGVGAVALQLSQCLRRARDLWITAQCPFRVAEAEAFCKVNGASETMRDDPIVVINSLHESSYDAVVDTVGGRRIYDAARRILHHEGVFVTVVGDELAPPTAKIQWRAGIRSLRRAFIKKDKKAIGYLCPGLDEREDCREALDRLCKLAEQGLVQPAVKRVLPFEEGGAAFGPSEDDDDEGVVIRIHET